MADTTTLAKAFVKPEIGAHPDTWGNILNSDFDLIDKAVAGVANIAISGDFTLSAAQAQNLIYVISGTLAANATLTFPPFYGPAFIRNTTSGGFALSCVMNTGGAAVSIAFGTNRMIVGDGTGFSMNTDSVAKAGDTMTGPLVINSSLTVNGSTSIGNYLFFGPPNGAVNTIGGPLVFADANSAVWKLGSGNQNFLFQNYAGTLAAAINSAGGITANSLGLGGVGGAVLNVPSGGITVAGNSTFGSLVLTGPGGAVLSVPGGGITVAGPCTLGSVNGHTIGPPGIVYPGTEGHSIAFGWNGANLIAHVDGTGAPGALASVGQLGGYMPLSGGAISGSLTIGGGLVVGGGGATAINVPSGGVNAVSVTISGIQLSNDGGGALYTPNKIRGAGLQSDGALSVGGGATIGGALTVNGTPLTCQNIDAQNDVAARGVFRLSPVGGSKGARIELCGGSSWDYVQFSVVGGGPGGAELYISPDANGSGFIIFADAGFSDARLKENIRDSEVDALAAILATPVRAFDWNEEGEQRMPGVGPVLAGLVADEVEKTMPFVVRTTSRDDMRRIVDQHLTPYLFRAIQQLTERLEALEAKV